MFLSYFLSRLNVLIWRDEENTKFVPLGGAHDKYYVPIYYDRHFHLVALMQRFPYFFKSGVPNPRFVAYWELGRA